MKIGVWKIMLEVVKKPLDARKYGVSALLRYAMRGASSRLHSKAERVLRLLMSDSVLGLDNKLSQGKHVLSVFCCLPLYLFLYLPIAITHIFCTFDILPFYLNLPRCGLPDIIV